MKNLGEEEYRARGDGSWNWKEKEKDMRHRWKSETMKLCMEPAHCSLCAVSKNGQDATHEELWEAVKKLDVIIATKDELIHSYVRVMTLLSKEKNDD